METNGLADPCQVVQSFWLDDELCSKVSLHSCVTLIDCKDFPTKLESIMTAKDCPDQDVATLGETANVKSDFPENELLLRQLVYADKVLVNKMDLLSQDKRADALNLVTECIRKVNLETDIKLTEYSQVPIDYLISELGAKQ